MKKNGSVLNLAKQLMRELRIAADTIGERGSLRRAETLQKILSRVEQMNPETLGRIVARDIVVTYSDSIRPTIADRRGP